MHEAYKTITIVEKLPVSIESVAVCGRFKIHFI